MLNTLKRFKNRKEIKRLEGKLRGLEARLSSMKVKLSESRSTAEYWEEQIKTVKASSEEKRASLKYYWQDVKMDEAEVARLEKEIEEVKERLILLGFSS